MAWHGAMFVHQGYYAGAILRFRLQFPNEYPRHPPNVFFETDTFHPLVSTKDGKMNLGGRFQPWIPGEHHVFDILYYIKSVFKKDILDRLDQGDAFNHEAFRIYKESNASFAALARQTTDLSQRDSVIYDNEESPSMRVSRKRHLSRPPRSGLSFTPLDDVTLKGLRTQLNLTDWTKYGGQTRDRT